jgi:hypothetical protein
MGRMLKDLGELLHPPHSRLLELGYYALLVDDTISIRRGSATIGVWRETKDHLDFETATGIRQARLQSATAIDAERQTIDFVKTLNL